MGRSFLCPDSIAASLVVMLLFSPTVGGCESGADTGNQNTGETTASQGPSSTDEGGDERGAQSSDENLDDSQTGSRDETATEETVDWLTVDEDEDGLLGSEEVELGTDPEVADSDGDGYNDGDEVAGNTNPMDPDDHPYLGGWPIGACRDDIVGEGYDQGDVAQNFHLLDQFGDMVDLHAFCDRTIFLVGAAYW